MTGDSGRPSDARRERIAAGARAWFPCEHPERPNDALMVWHYEGCQGCHVAAVASERRWPDDPHVAAVAVATKPRDYDGGEFA